MSPMVLRVDIVYHINVAYDIIFTTDIFVPNWYERPIDGLDGSVSCHGTPQARKWSSPVYLDPKSTQRSRSGDMWTRQKEEGGPERATLILVRLSGAEDRLWLLGLGRITKWVLLCHTTTACACNLLVKIQPFSWNHPLWRWTSACSPARSVWVLANPDYIVQWNFAELIKHLEHLKQLVSMKQHDFSIW